MGRPPVLRSQLLAHGYSDDEVRRLCGSRGLVSVRRGAYVEPGDERLRRPEDRHALAVRAAVEQLGEGAVVSHASAAVLHGIALWDVPLSRVHVSREGRSGGRRSAQLHLHVAPLDADEVVTVDGIAVTSAAATVAALARTLPFEHAVVVADDALHRGLVTPASLAAAVGRPGRRCGTAAALRVLAFADGRAESPGESRSRVAVALAGLPAPVLQVPLHSADGIALGRVDFWWPEQGVVGEFDGLVKYGRLLRPGQSAGDVVFAEKVREDALREVARGVVRWTWAEIRPFDAVDRRIRRALGTV
ncbi:hypothetical protein I4I84_09830 [Pseudonocardia sp. KRD-182]|uniref:hypothetical protein n=1 Tax=Pseudonocardia oceani TaxID=2792013 RepID=UPI001C4A6D14|nr:hypothetical protein [Pseudonocardia oceani]MBW0109016.1 hypothetical protein [Pseudonocardia oceani]